jgi:hypothetical protein
MALVMAMLGAMTAVATRDARACGMVTYHYQRMAPERAERLLVSAKEAAKAGHHGKARSLAVEVATANGPSASVRARAWALAGLASWQGGQRQIALRSFHRAQTLDEGKVAIDTVLAEATHVPELGELKKALAA